MKDYMTIWIGLQIVIVILETIIRWSVTSLDTKSRCRGYALGVGAQFLWLAVFIHTQMWYLMPLLIIDGSIWLRGYIRNRRRYNTQLRFQREGQRVR